MSRQAMLDDLKRSGLTRDDAKHLGLKVLSSKQAHELVNIRAQAYQIPYYTISGKQNGFWRVRFLEEVVKKNKVVRYSQPANAAPQLYHPPLIPWTEIKAATHLPIWFTEGEKKAAKACKTGLPCIGLGGVWNWRSKREQLSLIPAFHQFNWEGREVTLCFDSDLATNPNVNAAMHALARELFKLGAEVRFKRLPETGMEKVGLDDYLLEHELPALLELPDEPFLEGMELLNLNNELAVLYDSASVFHIPTRQLYSSHYTLTKILYANKTIPKVLESGKIKEVNIVDEWLKSKWRREHAGVTYKPGCHQETTDDNYYNLWEGWGLQPKQGSVKPFLELIDHLTADSPKSIKKWLLQWLAYPLQKPGTKLYTSVLLLSQKQGTGKTLLGYTMGRIYGRNFQEVNKEDLHKAFNQWAERKQFILGDEITGSDKRQEADKLKSLITREQISINAKYQKEYNIPDCINYLLSSNHADALFLEDHDRRFCVIECYQAPKQLDWYLSYDQWYRDEGCNYVFEYLLNLDLSGFNPQGVAPETDAKLDMIDINKLDVDHWAKLVLNDPGQALLGSDTELWDTMEMRELVRRFLDERGYMVSIRQITTALKKVGIMGKSVRLDSKLKKLYPLRNQTKWKKQWGQPQLWIKQYKKERETLTKKASQEY